MTPNLLRQFWALVEGSHQNQLMSLDDNSLVKWLVEQLSGQSNIGERETAHLNQYARSKISLIRDLARYR